MDDDRKPWLLDHSVVPLFCRIYVEDDSCTDGWCSISYGGSVSDS